MDDILRTPLTDLADAAGNLRDGLTPAQQLAVRRVKVSETKDGATREVETWDKVATARLSGELAGELSRGGLSIGAGAGALQVVVLAWAGPEGAAVAPPEPLSAGAMDMPPAAVAPAIAAAVEPSLVAPADWPEPEA